MVLVKNITNNSSVEKESGSEIFMLAKEGNYFYSNEKSKYCGLCFMEPDGDSWTMFKTIECIRFSGKDIRLINMPGKFVRETEKGSMSYFLSGNSLVIDADINGTVSFDVDMRNIYDFDDRGRIYNITSKNGLILIEYKKYTDNVLESLHYTRYLAIKTDITDFENISSWKEKEYPEDIQRKSFPWKLYIFYALTLKCSGKCRISISYSKDRDAAIASAESSFSEECHVMREDTLQGDYMDCARECAWDSVKGLLIWHNKSPGYYAGLPWFFQIWTRDEAISLNRNLLSNDPGLARQILLERIKNIQADGRIQNRFPNSQLGTADGTGWVFFRLRELIESSAGKKLFEKDDIIFIREQLLKSIELQSKAYLNAGLIQNKRDETWMDTTYGDDYREGFRIEIQCLWLSMLSFINYLDMITGHDPKFREIEMKTKQLVKNKFFANGILKDGSEDNTIRPNIFLAYYLYPELLEKKEWVSVFENSLARLWLDWGGLSTIDKESLLFCDEYTGEDNRSYHRGDSWFFINNIAASCMIKLDKDRFRDYIEKIIKASSEDILYRGIIGRASEISSAKEQNANGSLFQLWSAATFIELADLYLKSCQKA